MQFLTGKSYYEAVAAILATGRRKNARCAVAFWGKDAAQFQKNLGPASQIICNLESGATNPDLIEKFQKAGIPVRTLGTLHAKVYRGTTAAIVGSANCSTNGLAVEEDAGWVEAGVRVEDAPMLDAIDQWLDVVWKQARPITKTDIKKARAQWSKRRQDRPVVGKGAKAPSLLAAMQKDPEAFEERQIYFVITTYDVSPEAAAVAEGAGWKPDEFYEDWDDFPAGALIIDMGYDIKRREGDVNGLYESFSPHRADIVRYSKSEKSKILYCPSINDIQGFRLTPQDERFLKKHIRTLWEGRPNKKDSDDAVAIPFTRARELLFSQKGKRKPAPKKRKIGKVAGLRR